MKIYFSPEYSGNVFIRPKEGTVMMDTVVTNTPGLVGMLELRMGLHYAEETVQNRMALYYKAMNQFIKDHPESVLAPSFKTAGLSTAKAVLKWRDELRMAGWDFDGAEISERLAAIIGIEEHFRKISGCDLAGRIHIVSDQLAFQRLDCMDLEVILPCEMEIMKPCVCQLLKAVEAQGAMLHTSHDITDVAVYSPEEGEAKVRNLKVTRMFLNQSGNIPGKGYMEDDDNSFLIYKFPDERTQNEFFAYMGYEDVDVWINGANKQMDNWLALTGKPRTGSSMGECTPHLIQLFAMGLGLFTTPLNVSTLVEWLNMPVHPIDGYFRRRLADTIATEGGYRNDKCRKVIQDYIEGKFEYIEDKDKLNEEEIEKLRRQDRKKRVRLVEQFLPSQESRNEIRTEEVKRFMGNLSSWARKHSHLMAESHEENQLWIEQLQAVAGMADAMNIMLDTVDTEIIDPMLLDSWMSTIYEPAAFTHAIAERGCRTVVDHPSKLVTLADKVVWMNFEGGDSINLECSFLYPSEHKALINKQYITPWEQEKETYYNRRMMMNAFTMTRKQLILSYAERRGGEKTQKHPLLIQMEEMVTSLDPVVKEMDLPADKLNAIEIVENGGNPAELQFEHADKLKWPDHFSPTTIGTLAEHPFDYLMEKLLQIQADPKAQMANIKATTGNVAHAVIEALFAPSEGQEKCSADEIAERIKSEFDKVYAETIEAKGAMLLLAEHQFDEKLFHDQLLSCLNTLLEIIDENHLYVVACEKYVEEAFGFDLPKAEKKGDEEPTDRDVLGYIDMTLEDSDGTPVVFDFKWTSGSGRYYRDLLSSNRSVQLEMYRHMLTTAHDKNVKRVAYFLMPEGRLYSKEKFVGKACTQVDAENNDDIVAQLCNAARFRKAQLERGIVEIGTDFPVSELEYGKATIAENLFPLKENEEGAKEANKYTNFQLFS